MCLPGSRLIVQHGIAQALVERVAARFAALRPRATWEDAATLLPIISVPQAARILGILEHARDARAQLRCDGGLFDAGPGVAHFQSTLIKGVTATNPAMQEEIFGPVLTVQIFADEEEALALAPHGHYGLAASVRTADIGRNGVDHLLGAKRGLHDSDRRLSPVGHRQGYRTSSSGGESAFQKRACRLRRGALKCMPARVQGRRHAVPLPPL